MKNLLLLLLLVFTASQSGAQTTPLTKSAYWTSPIMSLREADSLAKNDIIIVELENLTNNYASLKRIKKFNPLVKLIAYSNPPELFVGKINYRPHQNRWATESHRHHQNWFLKTAKGKNATYWPNMQMMNISEDCPKDKEGKTYNRWMADSLLVCLHDTIWDGYYMDNGGGNIAWVYQDKGDQIDANNDGRPDKPARLDSAWAKGVHTFLKIIRQAKGKNFILLANKGSVEFMDVLDGRFYEGFTCNWLGSKKNDGWDQCMDNAKKTGKYTIFQINSKSVNPANINFVAASAALAGVSVAIGQDNPRSYPFYKWNLGKAKGSYKKNGAIYYREFQNGRMEVNPTLKKGEWKPKKIK